MKEQTEPVTIRLPKDWRDLAEQNWDIEGLKFTYSVIIRAAVEAYIKDKEWK